MKKKASLWISGITTVAMLAVAVGSFAAWQQLADSTSEFVAKTDNPAVLTVSKDSTFDNTKILAPSGVDAEFTPNATDNLTATFVPTLANGGSDTKITYTIDTTKSDSGLFDTYLTTELLDGSTPVAADGELTSGKTYTLKVKFTDDYTTSGSTNWTEDARTAVANKSIKVTVNCKAEKNTP